MIRNLNVSGLLSFGPAGIDLPLKKLNVLIGSNGSGKSNLLEVLALLRSAPSNLPAPVKEMGGVREWLWKGPQPLSEARIEAVVAYEQHKPLRHVLTMGEHAGRFEVVDEKIEYAKPAPGKKDPYFFYRFQRGNPVLNDFQDDHRELKRASILPEQSILSQVRDPERYPALAWLQSQYEQIRMYRNWSFGPNAALRREQSTHGWSDFLSDGGENVALVLSRIYLRGTRGELLSSLRKLYEGIEDFGFSIDGGNVLLFLKETGGRPIPATRLSDGTLRYLCLLAILLHPEPPPLIAIEEPELGLHPDVIPHIADLLVRASDRTQLVVTTHSRMLIEALSDDPSSVLVCEKSDGQSKITRLDSKQLSEWLKIYSLGALWSMGEIGGNRW